MVLAPARRTDRILVLCYVLVDIVTVPCIFALTYWLRLGLLAGLLPSFDHSPRDYLLAVPFIVLIWLAVFANSGLYRPARFVHQMEELTKILKAALQLAVALMAASYLVKQDYSRVILLIFTLLSIPSALLARAVARCLARAIAPPRKRPRILVVGTGEIARNVIRSLRRLPGEPPEIAGVLGVSAADLEQPEILGVPVLGTLEEIRDVMKNRGVDEVFFASPELERSRILSIISEDDSGGEIHFRMATDLFGVATTEADLDSVARIPVIEVGPGGLSLSQRMLKRMVDIVLSIVLIILCAPLMVLITFVLALTSRGSPVFRQRRVGYKGREFTLVKFRTMKPEAAEYEPAPLSRGDERVTPVGRLLRRTSLDELPQLFNVLGGSMSMVGPRPEMPFIVADYQPWQRHRLSVKPGLTGLWQIMGRKDLPLHENIEYDFFYIRNQSLMLDFAIMLRTLSSILMGRGAY